MDDINMNKVNKKLNNKIGQNCVCVCVCVCVRARARLIVILCIEKQK